MKRTVFQKLGDFVLGKGFYIVLFLCVATIGISGYYLFSSLNGSDPAAPVAGTAQVTVTPTPSAAPSVNPSASAAAPSVSPVKPAIPSASPKASETPAPSASASAVATPAPTPTKSVATVYTWPVKGDIIQVYSPDQQVFSTTMDDWRTHPGIDIAAEAGAQVKAAGNGTVESVEQDYFMGTTVTIDHGNGVKSVYANLTEIPTVKAGDSVSVGDIIGSVGSTAKAESLSASHLHFEMTNSGAYVDPADYLPELH